ncbi:MULTISPECIES: DUF2065 domain-containing protein [Pseudovibrio]|uniref:DUF2065 domain-containing protein n=1 Tax=Stappiaceae TaxID=2821832 RepID=UPI0023666031|nr:MULTISPECIES: DUF2065 domain-containing protein [Pseudovibrio]MDD7910352.1 DUF2065 domain-containing protein [Pseudovibrio exalbescens]MDX5594067.1 DUF2065 domain-containing protein [Pseudovibrio sp. SPO723]
MSDLIVALGLVLVIEGIVYALAPTHMKDIFLKMQEVPEQTLRIGGLVAIAIGFVVVWFVRSGG